MLTKYPALIALVGIFASIAKIAATAGETLAQRGTALIGLFPQIMSFIPQMTLLSGELSTIGATPADEEALAEQFVTDLAFTSDKAKSIITPAFAVAEGIANLVSPIESLITALKA
jgi:hypothetical protein